MRRLAILGAAVMLTALQTFAAEPAPSGRAVYIQRCASCHGTSLEGKNGPALKGMGFQAKWSGRTDVLLAEIANKMPPESAGNLPPAELKAVQTFVIAENSGGETVKAVLVPPKLLAPPAAVKRAKETGPTAAELVKPVDGAWPMYNRDYHGTRYSPLNQITPANVKTLAPRCLFQTGEVGAFQSSPLVYGKRLYITTAYKTYAIDAATCKKLWEHEYILPQPTKSSSVNRGAALYEGKIFRGTPDAHLLALDAATGELLWDVWVADSDKGFRVSAAPVVFDGIVIVGEGGADVGATGHIHGFDGKTGKLLWTFNMVPTGKETGADSWKDGGAKYGGGSTWSTMSVDPSTGSVYVPIGNPGSSVDGSVRPGDNLFTNSVVVLDARTGKLRWYVQQVPHDVWDWDTAAAPMLYELGGRSLMSVASKDGWVYFYDQTTRKLLTRQEISSHLNADKAPTTEGVRFCPGTVGGAEWYGPTLDPGAKLVFVNSVDWCATLKIIREPRTPFAGSIKLDPAANAKGWLRAFDAATGDPKWVFQSGAPMVAGITTTASGVLFTGSLNGEFWAFNAKTGEMIYRFNTGGAIAGGVSSYAVDGKQYVAVASGNASKTIWQTTGAPTIIVFGLP